MIGKGNKGLYLDYKNVKKKRKPAYTISDFSRKVGIPISTLVNRLNRLDKQPTPLSISDGNRRYYHLEDLEVLKSD